MRTRVSEGTGAVAPPPSGTCGRGGAAKEVAARNRVTGGGEPRQAGRGARAVIYSTRRAHASERGHRVRKEVRKLGRGGAKKEARNRGGAPDAAAAGRQPRQAVTDSRRAHASERGHRVRSLLLLEGEELRRRRAIESGHRPRRRAATSGRSQKWSIRARSARSLRTGSVQQARCRVRCWRGRSRRKPRGLQE